MDHLTPEDIQDMAGQLQSKQAAIKCLTKFEENLRKLEQQTFTGEAVGGAAVITLSGYGQLVRVEIDDKLLTSLADGDKVVVEEIIKCAHNIALEKLMDAKTQLFGGTSPI